MKFDKDHKVKIETMNEAEARAFILFLDSEIKRHQEDIKQAIKLKSIILINLIGNK